MKIAGREIGPGHPCFIVAEISCNHMGTLSNAYKLIDCAWWAGADAVKFQCFTLDEILGLRGEGQAVAPWDAYTKRELYTKAQTPFEWFPELFQHARGRGIIPFSSVMGAESLALLESLDCPAYKIAKPEAFNSPLRSLAVATDKPVLASWDGEDYAPPLAGMLDAPHLPAAWLYCPPGYPTRTVDVHLPDFGGTFAGLSSHCLAPELPIAAVARGAFILEYHLKLNGTTPLDGAFSHTPQSFKDMIDSVRRTEALLG